jgi:hypothetical protein
VCGLPYMSTWSDYDKTQRYISPGVTVSIPPSPRTEHVKISRIFSHAPRGFSHGHSPAIICISIPVISDGGGGEESSSKGWRFFSWEPMQIFRIRLQKTRKGGMLAKVQKQFYKKAKLRWSRDVCKSVSFFIHNCREDTLLHISVHCTIGSSDLQQILQNQVASCGGNLI